MHKLNETATPKTTNPPPPPPTEQQQTYKQNQTTNTNNLGDYGPEHIPSVYIYIYIYISFAFLLLVALGLSVLVVWVVCFFLVSRRYDTAILPKLGAIEPLSFPKMRTAKGGLRFDRDKFHIDIYELDMKHLKHEVF